MKAGVWKLRGIRRGWEKKEHAPYAWGNEVVEHILLSCPETKKMENAIYK
jgi:hypothetical protein